MLTAKQLSSTKAANVEDIHALAVAERFRIRYDNAYTTFFNLDEEQISLFSNMIGRYVKLGKRLRTSQHPIASALNEFARTEANNVNKGDFLNIGGNPAKERGVHFCNLVNDCRNEARLHRNFDACCINGAENCFFKSKFAVSVDSLYDISFENLYIIFDNHDIEEMHAWMFLPLELIDDDIAKIPNPLFRLKKMDDDGKKVAFSFVNDFSTVYIHDRLNWSKYLTNTCIIGDKFCIDIEIVKTYGPFCHLIFHRVGTFKPSTRILPFFDFYANFIKIPDYRYLVSHDFNVKFKNLPKIVVPKFVFQKLYSYVTRGPDHSFSYERGATYFHGITSKIIIGNQVYVDDLGLMGHEYDDVLFSVMCLSAQSRLRRTKNFGSFMRAIDNEFKSSGCKKYSFFDGVKSWFNNVKYGKERRGDIFNESSSNDFMMFDFEFFENKFQNGVIDVRTCCGKVKDSFNKRKVLLPIFEDEIENTTKYFEGLDQPEIENSSKIKTPGEIVKASSSKLNSDLITVNNISENKDNFDILSLCSSIDTIGPADDLLINDVNSFVVNANKNEKENKNKNLKIKERKIKNNSVVSFKSQLNEHVLSQSEFDGVINQRLSVDDFSLKIKNKKIYNPYKGPAPKPHVRSDIDLKNALIIADDFIDNNSVNSEISTNSVVDRYLSQRDSFINLANVVCENNQNSNQNVEKISVVSYDSNNKNLIDQEVFDEKCRQKIEKQSLIGFVDQLPSDELNKIVENKIVLDDISFKFKDENKIVVDNVNVSEKIDKELIIEKDCLNDCVIDNVISEKLNCLIKNNVCSSDEVFLYQNLFAHFASDDDLYKKVVNFEKKILESAYDGKLTRGAAKMKYMLDKYFNNWQKFRTLDVSLAPGYYATLGFEDLFGGYYIGEDYTKAEDNLLRKYKKVFKYDDVNNLNFSNYKCVLIDIGNFEHDAVVYNKILLKLKLENEIVICKFFLEHFDSCLSFCNNFKDVIIIKPAFSFSLNREFYVICKNLKKSDHTNYVKASIYSIFKCIVRAHQVYSKGIFPEFNLSKPIKTDMKDKILVEQNDVNSYINDLISSVSLGKNTEISEFIKNIITILKDVEIDFDHVNVEICNGPPGAAKSVEIVNEVRNGDIIIVPSRVLKEKYEQKLRFSVKAKKVKTITMHKIFEFMNEKFNTIYIDEASMQTKGYFALIKYFFKDAKIKLYFDSEQIGTVDFNKTLASEDVDFETKYDYNRNTSFRCPLDVSYCYTKPFSTFNKKIFSIVNMSYTDFLNKPFLKALKFICLTQDTKKRLIEWGHDANTVHEYQGGQDEHVVFYNDINDLILTDRMPRHINVAMSRHSNSLIVVGKNICNYDLCIQGNAMERMMEMNGIPVTSETLYSDFSDGPIERFDAIKLCKIDDHVMHDKRDNYDLNRVIDVIGKFINIYGTAGTFKSVRTIDLPTVKQGKAMINPDIVCVPENVEKGTYLTEFNTARNYDSKDFFTATKTLLGRYGLKTHKFTYEEINEGVLNLERGANIWLKYKIDSKEFNSVMYTTQEEWSECFIDYCVKLNKKKNLKPTTFDLDISDLDQKTGLLAIDYFMKKQDKYDSDYEMITKQKLGQGVNSWGKMLNVVYAAYCRLFSRKLRLCMKDNVIFANGLSDVEIGNFIGANIQKNRKEGIRYVYAENDMEEYDTSQNEITIENECRMLKRLGCNDLFVMLYRKHRLEWSTSYAGYCKFIGYAKKHSGEPFTLDFNTWLCMCLNGLMFPLNDFVYAGFKGDDSDIMSDDIKVCERGVKICAELGFKTKLRTGPCSEFIGYIVTPYGFYPDLLRVACKILNKRIGSWNHGKDDLNNPTAGPTYFEELKLAAHDRMQVIDCYEVRDLGRKMYMEYMNTKFKEAGRNEMLNANDVHELENFLFSLKNIEYKNLIKCDKINVFLNNPN